MPYVRVLRHWRGLKPGIFADVRGRALKDGLSEGSLDDKVSPDDVPEAEQHDAVIGEDEPAKGKKD